MGKKVGTALWPLHDSQGNPVPPMARSFIMSGMAQQPVRKTSMLARSGTVRVPVIHEVLAHEEHPGPDVLLLERLCDVPVEVSARMPERWEYLGDQVIKGLLS